MQIKNIELPFTQEWYDNAAAVLTPDKIQTAINRAKLLPENEAEDFRLMLAMGIILATPAQHGTATISRTRLGQFKVKFKADNGENLSPQDHLHNEKDLRATLAKYFSTFKTVKK